MPGKRGCTENCGVIISASDSGRSTSPAVPGPPRNSHSAYAAMFDKVDRTDPGPNSVRS